MRPITTAIQCQLPVSVEVGYSASLHNARIFHVFTATGTAQVFTNTGCVKTVLARGSKNYRLKLSRDEELRLFQSLIFTTYFCFLISIVTVCIYVKFYITVSAWYRRWFTEAGVAFVSMNWLFHLTSVL